MIRTPTMLIALGAVVLAGAAAAQPAGSGGANPQGPPPGGRVGASGAPSNVPQPSPEPEGAASALVGADRPYQDPTLPSGATPPAAPTTAGHNPSAAAPTTPSDAKGKTQKKGAGAPAAQPGAGPPPVNSPPR